MVKNTKQQVDGTQNININRYAGISPGDIVFQGIQRREWFNDFDVVSSFKIILYGIGNYKKFLLAIILIILVLKTQVTSECFTE